MQPKIVVRPDQSVSLDPVENELSELSYMLSHDLAATVRHVSEFSRLLINDLGHSLTPKQQLYAERVQAAGGRCQNMMEQLLAFSRAQQKVMACVTHDVSLVLRMAMLELSAEIQASKAKITLGSFDELYGDPDLLLLLFRNLLDNAIKFRRPDVAPRITITSVSGRSAWAVQISDNGLGVAPEFAEKSFRMFQRLHAEGAYPGVGAGLALCRRIARRHGGDIRFIPQAEGACIELKIPRNESIH